MNIASTLLAIDVLAKAKITPHLIGRHGIGKSSIVKQYCTSRGYEMVEVRVGLLADAGDLTGIQEFLKDAKGNAYATKHVLPDWFMKACAEVGEAAKSGKKVCIFLDEINRGHKDLLQAVFELVLDYSLKGVAISEGSFVVAASNPPTRDYQVLDFSDSAFQDRFCHIKVEPTVEEFVQYGRGAGEIEDSILDYVSNYPQMLELEGEAFNLDFITPSRRSWDRVSKVLKAEPHSSVELELVMGLVGTKAAISFMDFRKTYAKPIKAVEVLNNYKETRQVVLDCIKSEATDKLGLLNQEIKELVKKQTELTKVQADNIASLIDDLPNEHAIALITMLGNATEVPAFSIIDGQSPGMYSNPTVIKKFKLLNSAREEAMDKAKKPRKKASA